jgi:uncharacterized protein YqeY
MERTPDPARLRQRLRESLKAALSARDGVAVAVLRSALAAIDNAEAADWSAAPKGVRLGVGAGEIARRKLSAQEVLGVLRAEVSERVAAAAEYERLGRARQALGLKAEAAALESVLEAALKDP